MLNFFCSLDIIALVTLIVVAVVFGIQEYNHKKRLNKYVDKPNDIN